MAAGAIPLLARMLSGSNEEQRAAAGALDRLTGSDDPRPSIELAAQPGVVPALVGLLQSSCAAAILYG